MNIKRIKKGHVTSCHWCKAMGNKVPAIWHLTLRNKQACADHLHELQELIRADAADRCGESEADYQLRTRYGI